MQSYCFVAAALLAAPAVALHEISGPSFSTPLNNTFVAEWASVPRLDFNQLSGPQAVVLDDVSEAVQALYDAAGVLFIRVLFDGQVALPVALEEANFPGAHRLAACPTRGPEVGEAGEAGPYLAANGIDMGVFGASAGSNGLSGYNIKFVESARQLMFSVQDSADADVIVVRTYLTSTNENGDEVRVLQEELEVPTSGDIPEIGVVGRDPASFLVCIQADESCFDEVEILRRSDASGDDASDSGFCIDDIMLGAIQHGRRYSLLLDDAGTRKQCGRAATLARGETISSRFVSVSSAADAEWQSIGLNHYKVEDNGDLNKSTMVVSQVMFGQLGEDFSNPDRIALQEGNRAFRFWPNINARDTFFEFTAFWLTDTRPDLTPPARFEFSPSDESTTIPAPFKVTPLDSGGHWHPSTLCEPGCGGQGYEKHHGYARTDRQGFTVAFYVNAEDVREQGSELVDDAGRAEFQLSFFDYRNVGGSPSEADYPGTGAPGGASLLLGTPDAPDHSPDYAPLEVCVGPNVALEYNTLAEWLACPEFHSYGIDQYLPASHLYPALPNIDSLGCCGRLVFGCVFLGADEATVHACLWYEITNQGQLTRDTTIWDTFQALGAEVGSDADELIDGIHSNGQLVRDEVLQWAMDRTHQIGAQANETKEAIWEHFEQLGFQLGNVSAEAQANITRDGEGLFEQIGAEGNETRLHFLPKAQSVWNLINETMDSLKLDTELIDWAVPIINKATADTTENIKLLLELIDLLDTLPSDIDAHTMLVVEIAEKEVLVRLLQLKARLASIDGERKSSLDDIKAQMTLNRIRLEKSVDFIRRLSDTSSESSS